MIKIKKVEINCSNASLKGVHGQIVYGNKLSTNSMASLISAVNLYTRADAIGVMNALLMYMQKHLKEGYSVSLGDLGTFRPVITNTMAPTLEDWKVADNLKKVKVRYTPSVMLKQAINLAADNVNVQIVG